MRKSILVLMVVSLSLLVASYAIAGGPNMEEGLWQITMSIMEIVGMPMQMPPQTFTHCMTKEDYVPQKEEPNQECKMVKQDVKGNTVTWIMECNSPEGKIVINGRATYRGTTFNGIVKVKQADMEITQKMNGKWIGKCK